MNVSRRSLILGFPAAAVAIASAPTSFARSRINVRDYGAVGDGIADDSDAIAAAVNAMTPGSILYFPSGGYRFARHNPPGGGAIVIAGMSDVDIMFESDAELVMDNVDSETGVGTGHGILIRGPASNISLRDVTIRWARPSTRSVGDGVRVAGYPTGMGTPVGWSGAEAPVSGITMTGCEIRGCPQAGVVMMGVSGVDVSGLRVQESRGDGLHFNACRQARVDAYSAIDTGDDGLALVTYYSESFAFDSAAGTFAFPDLTDWSNVDFTVSRVEILGGRANGVRLAGVNGADISDLEVTGVHSGAGVIVDSASVGSGTAWNYVAARGIRMHRIALQDCESGIHVLARSVGTDDQKFRDFDVYVYEVTARQCSNWSLRGESLTDQRMTGLQVDTCSVEARSTSGGHGGVGLGNADDVRLGIVSIRHEQAVAVFQTDNSAGLFVGGLHVAISDTDGSPDPSPCIELEESQGAFDQITVKWPGAPQFWHPIRIANQGVGCDEQSGAPPVAIRALGVDPESVAHPVTNC